MGSSRSEKGTDTDTDTSLPWPQANAHNSDWGVPDENGRKDHHNDDDDDNDNNRNMRMQKKSRSITSPSKEIVLTTDTLDQPIEKNSQPPVAQSLSLGHEVAFVAIICLAQFSTQAGLGSVLDILGILGDSLGVTNRGDQAWLIGGYSLTIGTFILVSGRLGDLFGHKHMLLVGYAWFGAWSIVAGLAVYSGHVLFVFARVLSGIGPSLAMPNALAVLGVAYPPGPRKNLVFSLFGAVAPGGCVFGAVMASLFALAWWPWFFWAMGIILIVAVVLGYFVIPESPQQLLTSTKSRSISSVLGAVDALGSTVGVTALVLINFGWNQSGVVGWSHPYVYVLMIVGVLLVPVFFWIEFRIASCPLLSSDVLNKKVGMVLVCIACGWGSFGIWIFYTYQFFQNLRGASPLLTAAWSSPTAIVGPVASFITAYLLGRLRPVTIMTIAMIAFTLGSVLIATAPVHQIYWSQTFVMTIIISFGMDMSFPAASLIMSDAVPRDKQGVGMSLVNTVVNYSISFALGVASTIEIQVTKDDAKSAATTLKGYRSAWYFGISLAGLGVAISVINLITTTINKHKVSRSLSTKPVAVALAVAAWRGAEDSAA